MIHCVPTSNLSLCVITDPSGIIITCERAGVGFHMYVHKSVYSHLCSLSVAVHIHHPNLHRRSLTQKPQRWCRDKCVSVALCAVECHATAVRWATLLTASTQRMNYTWLNPQLRLRLPDIKAKWQLWHVTVLMYLKRSCSSESELSM